MSPKPMPTSRISNRKVQIIGHRGGGGLAPENTLSAFEIAVNLGIDAVEFDVQRTIDGHLVIFHDEDLERVANGSGMLRHQSLADLQKLDAGSHFDAKFSGEKIPTLEALFDFMQGNDLILHIELKDPFRYQGIEEQVAGMIRRYDFVERTQVRSFYHDALHTLHEVAPEIAISELWGDRLPADEETHFLTINGDQELYTMENIAAIHGRGQKATAYTVNEVEKAQYLIEAGIDGLTSDFPDRLLILLEAV